MRSFIAGAAAVAELDDVNVLAVVMAEHADGRGTRLEVQGDLRPEERDPRDGPYCLCTDDGATYYGGVISWRIVERVLEIVLDSDASMTLDADGGFHIELPTSSIAEVANGLERVLPDLRDRR